MKTLSKRFLVGLFLITLSPLMRAESTELCGDILRYASKNVESQVTFNDQRKYYYEKVCKDSSTGIGINYKDAVKALGLSYSSKDAYCKDQQSFDINTSYSRIDSSYVVQNALSAYVQCRALNEKGIITSVTIPPTDNPTVFSIGIQNNSPSAPTIQTVSFDPETVSCTTQKSRRLSVLNKSVNNIAYVLPNNKDKWSLVCNRKNKTDSEGNKTYAPVQLIVTTTAGDLPLSLPSIGSASSSWVSGLRSENILFSQKLDTLSQSLNALKNEASNQSLFFQCSGNDYYPRPQTPGCPAGYADSGQMTQMAPGGPSGYGQYCRVCLKIIK